MREDEPQTAGDVLLWAYEQGMPALVAFILVVDWWLYTRICDWRRIPDYGKIARLERELFGESE